MRFITYASAEGPRVATLQDEWIVDLNRTDAEIPCSLRELLAQGPEGLRHAEAAGGKAKVSRFHCGKSSSCRRFRVQKRLSASV